VSALPYSLPTTLPGDATTPSPAGAVTPGGGVDGTLTGIDDLCGQSIALLLSQYSESPLLQGLLCAIVDQEQEIDDAAAAVYERVLDVGNAEGVNLEILGRIVGEVRNGETDALFRRAILTRVLVNRSQGRLEDLIDIIRTYAALTGADSVWIQDVQPARLEVRVNAELVVPGAGLLARLKRAKAAGVALSLIVGTPGVPANRLFILGDSSDAYPNDNTTQGMGDTLDAAVGGYLSTVLV